LYSLGQVRSLNFTRVVSSILYFIEYSALENDVEIFPAHYTWKVPEKGFKMAFTMNKLAIINSCEIILQK
jgi:hypothetical protein